MSLRAQIGALQAQVESLLETVEVLGDEAPVATPSCPHTETENLGTFGAPDERCKLCGVSV